MDNIEGNRKMADDSLVGNNNVAETDIDFNAFDENETSQLDTSFLDVKKENGLDFPEGLTAGEKLEWWYSHLTTFQVDLISQMGGSSGVFFIHAESLILRFALDPRLRADFNTSPQFLRLCFYIEGFLNTLRQCGGLWRLVFFDDFKPLLKLVSPGLATFREAFLLSCQMATNSDIPYVAFSSFVHNEFRNYVLDWQPAFILVDECSDLFADNHKDDETHIWSIPYGLVYTCLHLNIHTAFLCDFQSKGRKIYSFVTSPPTSHVLSSIVSEYLQKIQSNALLENESPISVEDIMPLFENVAKQNQFHHMGLRDFIIAFFLRESIQVDEADNDGMANRELALFFGKMLLLISHLCRSLPLQSRSLAGFGIPTNEDGEPAWEFDSTIGLLSNFFLSEVSRYFETFVQNSSFQTFQTDDVQTNFHHQLLYIAGEFNIRNDLMDFIDCSLLRNVIIFICQHAEQSNTWIVAENYLNIPTDVLNEINILLQDISDTKGIQFFPLDLSYLKDQLVDSIQLQPKESLPIEDPELLVLQNPFFSKLMGITARKGYDGGIIPKTRLTLTDSKYQSQFWENGPGKIWSPSLLLDVAEFEVTTQLKDDGLNAFVNEDYLERFSGAQKERMRRKIKMRIAQKGAARIHQFGASLGAPSQCHHAIVVDKLGQHVWSNVVENESSNVTTKSSKKTNPSKSPAKKETNPQKKEGVKKVSSKADAIIKKNEEIQKKKIDNLDKDRLPTTLGNLNSIATKNIRPAALCNKILDVCVGHLRLTEEMSSFTALTAFLQLPESQLKVLIRASEVLYVAITKIYVKQEITTSSLEEEMHNLICFTFQFVHQIFYLYQNVVGEEEIKKLQALLICIGFVNSAKGLYNSWVQLEFKKVALLEKESQANVSSSSNTRKKNESIKLEQTKFGKHHNDRRRPLINVEKAQILPSQVLRSEFAVPQYLECEVQMKFMGHQMRRSLGSAPDRRVKFNPDGWQVRLLDAIDERRSALVCAPTGCGKTYACYYAMEKVLTFDNDSICVFVCPSKALVQQVLHEVNARFSSKEYPPACQVVLTASMLPGFYDKKALKCQILLTLPSVLEMLLMSSSYRDWVGRLKYVILDEVHCIGEGDEEGRYWERLIQLMPCPFIALSATVGNPGAFHQWLAAAHVSSEHGVLNIGKPNVEIIKFEERYADLSSYIFSSDYSTPSSSTTTLAKKQTLGGLFALNPFVCVTYKQIYYEGLSKDFYVTSADLLKAYFILSSILSTYYTLERLNQLSLVQRAEVELFISLMAPKNYFTETAAISKRQYRYYLHWFKTSLEYMVHDNILSEKLFDIFIQSLSVGNTINKSKEVIGGTVWNPQLDGITPAILSAVNNPLQPLSIEPVKVTPLSNSDCTIVKSQLKDIITRSSVGESYRNIQNLLTFCRQLNGLGLLPALMFNFSRNIVAQLYTGLVRLLVHLQSFKFYGTPEASIQTRAINKKRMDDYKALVKHHEMIEKLKTVSKKTREEEDIAVETDNSPLPPMPGDIAEEYDEEFNFSNRRVWGTNYDEIEDIINGVKQKSRKKDAFIIEGLRRGIGFHHSGLSRRYRAAVEMLFRMGYLRIVFSTETLSLGVNMPCKSTVFLGDSVSLTPLMYRQTSGRAGRRGFDVIGHVVFWEMPFSKLRRLMCARLPVLSGEFPISPTEVLRTYQLSSSVYSGHYKELLALRQMNRPVEFKQKEMQFHLEEKALEESLLRLYRMPLFSVSTVDAKEDLEYIARLRWAIKYAFRFSVDLARRYDFLTSTGDCSGLAGLITFLYAEAPGNIAVACSLLSGNIHSWLQEQTPLSTELYSTDRHSPTETPAWKLRRLITILAYFFSPVPLSYNVYVRMRLTKNFDPLLPGLPNTILSLIQEHNRIGLKNAVDYVRSFSSAAVSWKEEAYLPVSKLNFTTHTDVIPQSQDTTLFSDINSMITVSRARSPFAALSGRCDTDFISSFELSQSKPQNVYFEESLVSQIMPRMVKVGDQIRPLLSNYVTQFYTFKDAKHTAESSCIDPNNLWTSLTRFELALRAISNYVTRTVMLGSSKCIGETNVPTEDIVCHLLTEVHLTFEQFKKAEAA